MSLCSQEAGLAAGGRSTSPADERPAQRCDTTGGRRGKIKGKMMRCHTGPPQVMLTPILLGSERQKSFALPLDCDAVSGFNGICQKCGPQGDAGKTRLRAAERFGV